MANHRLNRKEFERVLRQVGGINFNQNYYGPTCNLTLMEPGTYNVNLQYSARSQQSCEIGVTPAVRNGEARGHPGPLVRDLNTAFDFNEPPSGIPRAPARIGCVPVVIAGGSHQAGRQTDSGIGDRAWNLNTAFYEAEMPRVHVPHPNLPLGSANPPSSVNTTLPNSTTHESSCETDEAASTSEGSNVFHKDHDSDRYVTYRDQRVGCSGGSNGSTVAHCGSLSVFRRNNHGFDPRPPTPFSSMTSNQMQSLEEENNDDIQKDDHNPDA